MEMKQNPSKCLQLRFGNDLNPMRLIFSDKNQDVEINLDPCDSLFYKSGKYIPPKEPWIPPPARTKKPTAAMARNSNHFPLNELVIGFPNGGSGLGLLGPPFTIKSSRLENFKASFYPQIKEDPSLAFTKVKGEPLPPLTPRLVGTRKVLESLAETKFVKGSTTEDFEMMRRHLSEQISTVKDQISAIEVSISNLQYQQKNKSLPVRSSTEGSKRKISRKLSDDDELQTNVTGADQYEKKLMKDMRESSYEISNNKISERPYDNNKIQKIISKDVESEKKVLNDAETYFPAVSTADSYTTKKCASQDQINENKLIEKSISEGICPIHPLVRFATCTGCQILEQLQSMDESKRRKTCPAFTSREDSKTGPIFTKKAESVESESSVSEENNVKKLADNMRKSKEMVDCVFEANKSASNVQVKYIKNAEALFNEQQSVVKALCSAFEIAKKIKLLESCSSESSQKESAFESSQKESSSSKETSIAPSSDRVENPQQVIATLENDINALQSQIQIKKNELEQMMRRSSKIKKTSDSALSEELLQATAQAKVLKQGLIKVKAAKKKLESELSEQQSKINKIIGQRMEFSFDPKRTSSKKILDANDTAIDWDDVNSKLNQAMTDIVHEYSSTTSPEFEETSSHTTIDRSNKNFYGTAEAKKRKESLFLKTESEFPKKESEFKNVSCEFKQMENSMRETMKLLAPVMEEKRFKNYEVSSKSNIGVDRQEERFSLSLSDRVEATPKRSKSGHGRSGRGLSSKSSLHDERIPAKGLSTENEVYKEDSKTDNLDESENGNETGIRGPVSKEFSDDGVHVVESFDIPEDQRGKKVRYKSVPTATVQRPVFIRAKSDAPKGYRQQQRGSKKEDKNFTKHDTSSNKPFPDRSEEKENYRIQENGKIQEKLQVENNATTPPKRRESENNYQIDSSKRDEIGKPNLRKKEFSDTESDVGKSQSEMEYERVEADAQRPDDTIVINESFSDDQSIKSDGAEYIPFSVERLASKEIDPKKDKSFEFYVADDEDVRNDLITPEKDSRPTESEGPPSDSFLTGSRETGLDELTQHSISENDNSWHSRQSDILEDNNNSRGNKTRRKLEFDSDSNFELTGAKSSSSDPISANNRKTFDDSNAVSKNDPEFGSTNNVMNGNLSHDHMRQSSSEGEKWYPFQVASSSSEETKEKYYNSKSVGKEPGRTPKKKSKKITSAEKTDVDKSENKRRADLAGNVVNGGSQESFLRNKSNAEVAKQDIRRLYNQAMDKNLMDNQSMEDDLLLLNNSSDEWCPFQSRLEIEDKYFSMDSVGNDWNFNQAYPLAEYYFYKYNYRCSTLSNQQGPLVLNRNEPANIVNVTSHESFLRNKSNAEVAKQNIQRLYCEIMDKDFNKYCAFPTRKSIILTNV